ncbi:MAG: hypothetical protein J0H25_06185, partial [Rhizobiales bacterium]|nr:hypothetical protein [Hyphomicrobiales bacterium]
HRLTDPDAGDTLLVVTAKPPARGFVKRQDMVELSVLESVQGVVVRPKSDDVTATVSSDSVTLARPGGLTLSSARMQPERATASVRPLFDDAVWRDDRAAAFLDRRNSLIDADAAAEGAEKVAARLALARFYMAWGMYPEAKAVLDISLSEANPGTEDATTLTMHALADGDGTTPAAPGQRWTLTFADTLKTSSEPPEARRNVVDPRRATITI